MLKLFVLAPTYSRLATTLGSGGLNFRVRNENGCDPSDKAPEQNFLTHSVGWELAKRDVPPFAKPPTHNFQTLF